MLVAAAAAFLTVVAAVLLRLRWRRRVWIAAFLEQGRREQVHHLDYREEQTVTAIQQRLSRHIGKKAFSARTRRRIEKELRGGVEEP